LEQKKISAKEAVADIKAGIPDDEMMKKYGLSAKGLQSLFAKLHQAKLISTEEYQRRAAPSEQTLELVDEGGEKVAPANEKSLEIFKEFATRFNFSRADVERLKTASIQDIRAFLDKYHVPISEAKDLLKSLGFRAGEIISETQGKLKESLGRVISGVKESSQRNRPPSTLPHPPPTPLDSGTPTTSYPADPGKVEETKTPSRVKPLIVGGLIAVFAVVLMILYHQHVVQQRIENEQWYKRFVAEGQMLRRLTSCDILLELLHSYAAGYSMEWYSHKPETDKACNLVDPHSPGVTTTALCFQCRQKNGKPGSVQYWQTGGKIVYVDYGCKCASR
jgi:hypothetical protein